MNVSQRILEAKAGVKYRIAAAQRPLYRRAFAQFGAGSVIINPQMLAGVDRISIGDNVMMREGAWLATEGPSSSIAVGANCYFGFRPHVHSIDTVSIGSGCVCADNVMITTTDHDRVDRHAVHGTGPVVIEDDVFLGQNVTVLGGVHIGRGATVAAGAVVVKNVPAGAVVGGIPAKVLD